MPPSVALYYAIVEAINKALEELKADGTLSKLSIKYFGTDITTL